MRPHLFFCRAGNSIFSAGFGRNLINSNMEQSDINRSLNMQNIRHPAVAGTFYPADQRQLAASIRGFLDAAGADAGLVFPKAIIVPHAGYIYSGQTAAEAYSRLAAGRNTIRRVVLLGPTHRLAVRGLALPEADSFETPLGRVALDKAAMALLRALPQVVVSAEAHAHEHSLEVQLPFLQTVLEDFSLVPLLVGDADAGEVAEVLDTLWGNEETVIVVSSDLSHYLSYSLAQEIDQLTVQKILAMKDSLTHQQACGGTPINGLVRAARKHRLHPSLLAMCNSGDSVGDKQRVVGYAAFIFSAEAGDA